MKKFKLSVLIIAIGTVISKCLGLLREMFLAQKFGAGYISDSFILALSIPNILITSIAAAVKTNYIPIVSGIEEKEDVKKFNGILINCIVVISTILVLVFFLFTKPIVKIFAVGFDENGLQYLVNLSRITIFAVYIILTYEVLKGHLEHKEKFLGTALYGILNNIGILLGIYFSTEEKYHILGYGIIAGYILSFLFFAIFALKNDFKFKMNLDFKNTYFKKLIMLTLPLLLNSAIWEINGLLDKSISSTLGEGYISSLNYAVYIVNVIVSLFITSVGTVIFPKIIAIIRNGDMEKLKYIVKSIIKMVILFTIPCTIFLTVFSEDIVRVIFFRGEFQLENLYITSNAIKIYSIGIVFTCLQSILYNFFYALQDTKTPTLCATISIILNIILNIVFSRIFGYKGIVSATVIATAIAVILLIYYLNKDKIKVLHKDIIIEIGKILISNVVLFIIVILLYNSGIQNIFFINDLISTITIDIIIAIIGVVIYGATILGLRVDLKDLKN